MVYLFFPDTDAGRAAGPEHLARVSTRLATGRPKVSDEAAKGQREGDRQEPRGSLRGGAGEPAEDQASRPLRQRRAGRADPALASYVAVQHLDSATLVLYSDAGHAFLFQHATEFATQVANFLAD